MFDTTQDIDPGNVFHIKHIKARSRAKLAWIVPLSCLVLAPLLEKTSLAVGFGLGMTFLIVTFLDMRQFGKREIWLHSIAGSVTTLVVLLLLVLT